MDQFVKQHNFKIVLLSQLTITALFVLMNDMTALSNNKLNNLTVLQLFKSGMLNVNISLRIKKSNNLKHQKTKKQQQKEWIYESHKHIQMN